MMHRMGKGSWIANCTGRSHAGVVIVGSSVNGVEWSGGQEMHFLNRSQGGAEICLMVVKDRYRLGSTLYVGPFGM